MVRHHLFSVNPPWYPLARQAILALGSHQAAAMHLAAKAAANVAMFEAAGPGVVAGVGQWSNLGWLSEVN